MGYCIDTKDRSVTAALRRIALEQIDLAEAALTDISQPLPLRVHTARKAVKKLRGLIRLVRPGFPPYHDENAALRRAGRGIAGLRQSHVLLDTFDLVAADAGLCDADRQTLRETVEGHAEVSRTEAALDATLAGFQAEWSALRRRARHWAPQDKGFQALGPGLARSHAAATRAADRAADRARTTGDAAEAVHDWRKRVKDHGYHLRLLAPLWPELMRVQGDAVEALGESLGQHQDIADLLSLLPGDGPGAALAAAARARQARILAAAHPASARIFAGSARAFRHRCAAWWQIWQDSAGKSP